MSTVRVLFVCMGNICRSPTAEGVFRKRVAERGLLEHLDIDSAGTGGWHEGEAPDRRAQAEARRRGIEIGQLRAREVRRDDFIEFDYILAMDQQNLRELRMRCPQAHHDKLRLMMEFAPHLPDREVPDPYYGGEDGFTRVFDMLEHAAAGLLDHIQQQHLSEDP